MQTGPAGVSDAIAELYRRHHLALLRLAVLLCGDQHLGERIVSDAFAALRDRWSAPADDAAAMRYLRISVVNGVRARQRHPTIARRFLPAAEPEDRSAADYATLIAEEHREVIAALRPLRPRQREVLVLRYWSELSESDIAVTLGISPRSVNSAGSRGLNALERQLRGSS
ncbi:MAG: sigma-70 family RNA polymerase sigma factor [Actinomycetota bacterium]|nr:sigma-70 family RNA polymerase sigma factor [Actinomycetota bacterium]